MWSRAVVGTEEGLEKAAKPMLVKDVWGRMGVDTGFSVVGSGVKGIGEGGRR